jgi:ABC-type branched-subunit amino acid transport system substrate-binding protein
MKPTMSRIVAAAVLAICIVLVSGASGRKEPILQPNKLVIISTTDVKGKTSPCG